MTRDEAIRTIRASVARGTATPIFDGDRDAEVARLAGELEASAIDPIPGNVLGIAYPDTGLSQLLADDKPYFIAKRAENWLGYLPTAGEFFLAYGPEPAQLNALGFHSTDALVEWRG